MDIYREYMCDICMDNGEDIIMDLLEQGNKDTEHPADKGDRLYHEEQDHKAMEKANDR